MKVIKLLAAFFCSLLVVSCSTYNIQTINVPEGPSATMAVYRPHYISGSNAPVVIAIDGVDIALLRNNTYLEVPIRPGSRVLSVRGFRVGRADEKEMTFKENTVVILKVDKPDSSVAMAAVPLAMHLSKLYYLVEEQSLTLDEVKSKFARVNVGLNQSK